MSIFSLTLDPLTTKPQATVRSGVCSVTSIAAFMLVSTAAIAHSDADSYNRLSFSTTVTQSVDNDEVSATLYTEIQDQDAAIVERQLTEQINAALTKAKTFKNIDVNSSERWTRPEYNYKKGNKLTGWRGRAAITLTTDSMTDASRLIAVLQPELKLQNIDFNVSDTTRQQVIKNLMVRASGQFQEEAKNLLPAWSANSYKLVDLQLRQGGEYPVQPYMDARVQVVSAVDSSMPAPDLESGQSKITMTATGTIELQR